MGGREGGGEEKREGEREGGRERGRDGGREGGMEGWREGGREGGGDSLQILQAGDEEAQSLQCPHGVSEMALGIVQLLYITGNLLHLLDHMEEC